MWYYLEGVNSLHSKLPIFRVKSVQIYTRQFFYTDTVCGVFDKYEVWLNVTKEIPAMTKNVSTKRVYADNCDGDDDDEKGVANALSANCLKVCTWLRIGSEDRSDPDFQNPQSLCISAANWPHFQCLILRSAFIRQGFS